MCCMDLYHVLTRFDAPFRSSREFENYLEFYEVLE